MERDSDKKADNCFRSLKAYVNGPLEIATETQDSFISSRRVYTLIWPVNLNVVRKIAGRVSCRSLTGSFFVW